MDPINVLETRLKAMDKNYEAYEHSDGGLFINYCTDNFVARIAVTLNSSIYLHPLDREDYIWLLSLIKKYLNDNGKDMPVYEN